MTKIDQLVEELFDINLTNKKQSEDIIKRAEDVQEKIASAVEDPISNISEEEYILRYANEA